ncbi:hypothetical protein KR222_010809 [Zaprionus bogoriensis]|nr:hypothetical protein KR222_010809 [Zaprionus bogoriensis]
MFRHRLWIHLLSFVLHHVQAQISLWQSPYEDDFVAVDFTDCKNCEHNFRNMVFVLSESSDQAAISIYSLLVLIMWFCLGVLIMLQRWRKRNL